MVQRHVSGPNGDGPHLESTVIHNHGKTTADYFTGRTFTLWNVPDTAGHRVPRVSAYLSTSSRHLSHLEEEGISVFAELTQQFPLDLGVDALLPVVEGRVQLPGGPVQLPLELDADHVHVIAAVAEDAGQRDKR